MLFQFFNAFNARVERQTAFTGYFFHNRRLWLALAVVLALQVLVVSWGPAQELMHTTALSLADWAVAVAVASCVLWVDEVRKLVERLVARRVG